jgi:hypothetical protein
LWFYPSKEDCRKKIIYIYTRFRISNRSPPIYEKLCMLCIFQRQSNRFINHGVFVGVVCMAFSKLFCFSVA